MKEFMTKYCLKSKGCGTERNPFLGLLQRCFYGSRANKDNKFIKDVTPETKQHTTEKPKKKRKQKDKNKKEKKSSKAKIKKVMNSHILQVYMSGKIGVGPKSSLIRKGLQTADNDNTL